MACASLQAKMFSSGVSSASRERRLLPFLERWLLLLPLSREAASNSPQLFTVATAPQHPEMRRWLVPYFSIGGGDHTSIGWHQQSKSCLLQLFLHIVPDFFV